MKSPAVSRIGLKAVVALSLVGAANAHSWVEYARRIAPNGTMVGAEGYPRGWIPRNSTDPLWKDSIPQLLLPAAGQSAYSGDEILNKFQQEENPKFPLLEASAGDHIALIHLENGHTTLPQNQPKKPQNRGTIFLYGTDKPKQNERLFDIHLVWNKDGTGGDRRGRLLGTRNYDDGQCFQPNSGAISEQRAAKLAPQGAVHDTELGCQSDVQLPSDLKAGSTYTIYWYWDWPDLNADHINFAGTKNGIYPWAGTFMRGEKDPNGFTMAAISKNESYASTIDIKITTGGSESVGTKDVKNLRAWVADQNIYSMGIKNQMQSNFQVNVDANGGSGGGQGNQGGQTGRTTSSPPVTSASVSAAPDGPTESAAPATVTVTHTVPPTTVWKTVVKTVPAEQLKSTATPAPSSAETPSQKPSVVIITVTSHVPATQAPASPTRTAPQPGTTVVTVTSRIPAVPSSATSPSDTVQPRSTVIRTITSRIPPAATTKSDKAEPTKATSTFEIITGRPTVTPFLPIRRRDWRFGMH